MISQRASLLLQTPDSLAARFRLDVRVRHEVKAIQASAKSVRVLDLDSDAEYVMRVRRPGRGGGLCNGTGRQRQGHTVLYAAER
ncbi:hypothetical protein MAFF212519_02460 [Clavibacter michiganensis]